MPVGFKLLPNTLFFKNSETGEIYNIGKIIDMNCINTNIEYSEEPIKFITESCEATFTITPTINKMMLRYISGLPVPNNWRKMHGIPMKRKTK